MDFVVCDFRWLNRWPANSIIGAHAVVNPDASGPEFAIAAGVPAKFLWGTEGT